MRLYDEIFKGEQGVYPRAVWLLGGGAYFQGVKAVGEFSTTQLTLFFAKGQAEVVGDELFIRKYCDGDLSLDGKIQSVQWIDGHAKGDTP